MRTLINVVNGSRSLVDFSSSGEFEAFYKACHADGVEYIRDGYDGRNIIKPYMAVGCHLIFYSDWVDFWKGDKAALIRKFGSEETARSVYSSKNRDEFIARFREDMEHAEKMGVEYAVFHVSDVSLEEGYTYRWEHSDREVIDASIELLNILTDGEKYTFRLLLENLWWKGFSMTDPYLTEYMLDKLHYENKGIMLDTGHLMNTNLSLRTQDEACDYIHRCLDRHGSLCSYIKGVHLHKSLSGAYVEEAVRRPPTLGPDYYSNFSRAYEHILKIDTHQPFIAGGVGKLIGRISPDYLVYELSAPDREKKKELCDIQYRALHGK